MESLDSIRGIGEQDGSARLGVDETTDTARTISRASGIEIKDACVVKAIGRELKDGLMGRGGDRKKPFLRSGKRPVVSSISLPQHQGIPSLARVLCSRPLTELIIAKKTQGCIEDAGFIHGNDFGAWKPCLQCAGWASGQ